MSSFVVAANSSELFILKAASLKPKCVLVKQATIPLIHSPHSNNLVSLAVLKPSSGETVLYLLLKSSGQSSLLYRFRPAVSLALEPVDCTQFQQFGSHLTFVCELKKSKCLLICFSSGAIIKWSPTSLHVDTIRSPSSTTSAGSCIPIMAVNCDESHLSFVENGGKELKLVSLTSNTQSSIITESATSPVTSLVFSYFKQSLLACGHEDGTVSLFDINSQSLLKTFAQAHVSSVTSVRFSPFNRYLMVSASVDKRYVLYDVEKQKIVRTITTQHALTSLSVHPNGVLLAVTSLDGRLLVYDLATGGKQPTFSFSNDSKDAMTGVHFISFDKETCSKMEALCVAQSKAKVTNETTKAKPAVNLADQSVNFMDVFSPISSKIRPAPPLSTLALRKPPAFNEKPPLDDSESPITTKKSSKVETLIKPVLEKSDKSDRPPMVEDAPAEDIIETPIKTINPSPVNTPTTLPVDTNEKVEIKQETVIITESNNEPEEYQQSHSTILQGNMEWAEKRLSELSNSIKDQIVEKLEELAVQKQDPQIPSMPSANTQFSKNIISSVIEDCLSDFRVELKTDIQNMHLDLLRQFELQNQIMRNMFMESTKHMVEVLSNIVADNAHPFQLSQEEVLLEARSLYKK